MLDKLFYIKEGVLTQDSQLGNSFQNAAEFCQQWNNGQEIFVITTSGSTGTPKSIKISRKQMQASAKMTIKALSLEKGNNALVCLNNSFIAGKMMLVRGIVGELNLYLTEPSSNPLLDVPHDLQIDFMAVVPLQLESMIDIGGFSIEKLNRMEAVIVGGAPISLTLSEKIKSLKCPVYATYGMTETVSHIALKRLNGINISNFYNVLDGVNIGQDDRDCLTINSVLTNHQTIVTNDIVELIDEQSFKWLGRIDHVINTGGIKVHPEQLENQIKTILHKQGINYNLMITGVPDQSLGEKVILILEFQKIGFDTFENIKKYLKDVLSAYHVPKEIYHLEKFIYTKTGKVKREETASLIY